MEYTLQTLRSNTVFADRDAAVEFLDTFRYHMNGQPVCVRYYDPLDHNNYQCLFAVGLKNGNGEDAGPEYYHIIEGGTLEHVQSDWNQSDNTQPDYIKNKPEISVEFSSNTAYPVTPWVVTCDTSAKEICLAVDEGKFINPKFNAPYLATDRDIVPETVETYIKHVNAGDSEYIISELYVPNITIMNNITFVWPSTTTNLINVQVSDVSGINYYIYDSDEQAVAHSYISTGAGTIDFSSYADDTYRLQLIEPHGAEKNFSIVKTTFQAEGDIYKCLFRLKLQYFNTGYEEGDINKNHYFDYIEFYDTNDTLLSSEITHYVTDTKYKQDPVSSHGWGINYIQGLYQDEEGKISVTRSDIRSATTSQTGIVELATGAETLTGTDNSRAVTPSDISYIKGRANGIASLDANGQVPSSQLPSYEIEGYLYNNHFYTDEEYTTLVDDDQMTGKIYVNLTDEQTYRWSGSLYIEISKQLQSDWNQTNTNSPDYIKNKPDVASLEDDVEDLQEDVEELQNGYFIPGWRTPTSAEWNYIINSRSASTVSGTDNARYAKAQINSVNGLILLPDVFELPTGITMLNINTRNATASDNTYTISQWETLENAGCIFLPCSGYRYGIVMTNINNYGFYSSTTTAQYYPNDIEYLFIHSGSSGVGILTDSKQHGKCVRLIKENTTGSFSISNTLKADIAKSNLQFHCLNKEWIFAPNAYDVIGNDNSNIAENYNGYIDLFGFGTSGWNSGAVAYQPWSSSTNNADYINHDLTGDYKNADWGVYNFSKQLQPVAFTGDYNDLENTPIPIPTVTDEGKMLQVNASGQYELVTIVNSELQPY